MYKLSKNRICTENWGCTESATTPGDLLRLSHQQQNTMVKKNKKNNATTYAAATYIYFFYTTLFSRRDNLLSWSGNISTPTCWGKKSRENKQLCEIKHILQPFMNKPRITLTMQGAATRRLTATINPNSFKDDTITKRWRNHSKKEIKQISSVDVVQSKLATDDWFTGRCIWVSTFP